MNLFSLIVIFVKICKGICPLTIIIFGYSLFFYNSITVFHLYNYLCWTIIFILVFPDFFTKDFCFTYTYVRNIKAGNLCYITINLDLFNFIRIGFTIFIKSW